MGDIFTAATTEQTEQQLADCLPVGDIWNAKNISGTTVRKLIKCISAAFNIVQQLIESLAREFNIYNSVLLLPEWEKSVSLPDSCTGQLSATLEGRRNDVIERLRKTPIVTLAEMQTFVNEKFPDLTIRLYPGNLYYGLEYELEATLSGANSLFIIVAEVVGIGEQLEYELEVELRIGIDVSAFECLMKKIIPANVFLQIVYVEA